MVCIFGRQSRMAEASNWETSTALEWWVRNWLLQSGHRHGGAQQKHRLQIFHGPPGKWLGTVWFF